MNNSGKYAESKLVYRDEGKKVIWSDEPCIPVTIKFQKAQGDYRHASSLTKDTAPINTKSTVSKISIHVLGKHYAIHSLDFFSKDALTALYSKD